MRPHSTLSKTMAITGTVLVALPVIAPLALGAVSLASGRGLMIDWLMPAELFWMVAAGIALLFAGAWSLHRRRAQLTWVLGVMIVSLFGGQAIATVTGLADGTIEAAGWPWALVTGMIALYALTVAAFAVIGGLTVRDLFSHPDEGHPPAVPAM